MNHHKASASDAELEQLLSLYDQLQGTAPEDAPPHLKELFESIGQAKRNGAGKASQAPAEWEEIYPTPEFVVKTTDANGRKVFINVCSSDKITAPGNWSGGVPAHVKEQLNHLEDVTEEGSEHLRFPLSLSEPYNDLDKQGEPCTVFDCVFATDVIKGAATLRQLKVFIIETSIGWIDHKHSLGLDERFKLPKLKYKGDTIRPQHIRREKKALVQEIGDVPDETPALPLRVEPVRKPSKPEACQADAADSATTAAQPGANDVKHSPQADVRGDRSAGPPADVTAPADTVEVVEVAYESRPCDKISAVLQLPANRVWDIGEVQVRAGLDVLHINAHNCAPQVVHLNCALKAGSVQCELEGTRLTISGQYWQVDELIGHMEATKPLPVGAIPLQSQVLLDQLD